MIRSAKVTALTLSVIAAGCTHSERAAIEAMQAGRPGLKQDRPNRLKQGPTDLPEILPATHLAAARLHEQQGLIEQAITQYRKAIALNHRYTEAYHRLGLLLLRVNQPKEAVMVLRKAVALAPKDARLRNDLGYAWIFVEKWDQAASELNKAIQIEPYLTRAHINLGLVYGRMGRFDEALDSFRLVLPEADAQYNLGLLLGGQGKYVEAAEAFTTVLQINPRFTAAAEQLARIEPHLPSKPIGPKADETGVMEETAVVTIGPAVPTAKADEAGSAPRRTAIAKGPSAGASWVSPQRTVASPPSGTAEPPVTIDSPETYEETLDIGAVLDCNELAWLLGVLPAGDVDPPATSVLMSPGQAEVDVCFAEEPVASAAVAIEPRSRIDALQPAAQPIDWRAAAGRAATMLSPMVDDEPDMDDSASASILLPRPGSPGLHTASVPGVIATSDRMASGKSMRDTGSSIGAGPLRSGAAEQAGPSLRDRFARLSSMEIELARLRSEIDCWDDVTLWIEPDLAVDASFADFGAIVLSEGASPAERTVTIKPRTDRIARGRANEGKPQTPPADSRPTKAMTIRQSNAPAAIKEPETRTTKPMTIQPQQEGESREHKRDAGGSMRDSQSRNTSPAMGSTGGLSIDQLHDLWSIASNDLACWREAGTLHPASSRQSDDEPVVDTCEADWFFGVANSESRQVEAPQTRDGAEPPWQRMGRPALAHPVAPTRD